MRLASYNTSGAWQGAAALQSDIDRVAPEKYDGAVLRNRR
jgi:hypothetical protein